MIITMKFRDPKGIGKMEINEKIALWVNKRLSKKQLEGKIGEKYPISKEEIQSWIHELCIKKRYYSIEDKTRLDFLLFSERLYHRIMSGYIRKDELTKDTDEQQRINIFYYPGLVNILGKGWIITNSDKLIEKYKDQRDDSLNGQKIHLKQKCSDAFTFVKMLPENQRELLDNGKNREII